MSKFKKIAVLLRTLRYLRMTQILHQVKNRFKKAKPLVSYDSNFESVRPLPFFDVDEAYNLLDYKNGSFNFTFLNLSKDFGMKINWDFQEYGKLWNYNLQYLDCLKQKNIETIVKLDLIHSLYSVLNTGSLKLEPYTVSLRIMNLIRFVSTHEIEQNELSKLNRYIKTESSYLDSNLEYHLLANHLLENLFAMNMSASYFKNSKALIKYEHLIRVQLEEQILNDGAHYELSPMYHKIIFFRVLELYHFSQTQTDFKIYLKDKLSLMFSWLQNISFKNDEVPDFNDSTKGITFSNTYFYKICHSLGIQSSETKLSDSGYRKFNSENFELIIDINGISPSYQPGHAHADTFSFCLNYMNKPFIIDPGISTYNISAKRNWERSTEAHNTLGINGENSAEVWSGFRVGRRLDVNILNDDKIFLASSHNGYKRFGVEVRRSIAIENQQIKIKDELIGVLNVNAVFNIHFHPDIQVEIVKNTIVLQNTIVLEFDNALIELESYDYCLGYNHLVKSIKANVKLNSQSLETILKSI